jgi:hypothetical protein
MSTAIKSLPELSAEGEGADLAVAGASGLPSLPPMPADAFLAWLERADPGASLTYYRGFLIRDRSPESHLPEECRRALAKVANAALDAAERGRVHLVQRRNGPFDFSYLAIKAASTGAAAEVARHAA